MPFALMATLFLINRGRAKKKKCIIIKIIPFIKFNYKFTFKKHSLDI